LTDTANTSKQNIPWAYIIGVAASILVAVSMLTVQWQSAIDKTNQLNRDIVELSDEHNADIARLDESNRNRRNTIAELEERVARLEERTSS